MHTWGGRLEAYRAGEREHSRRLAADVRRGRAAVCAVTVLAGGAVLAWSLRIPPGAPVFYPATLGLAATWAAGAWAARAGFPPALAGRWGSQSGWSGGEGAPATVTYPPAPVTRAAALGMAAGLALLVVFLLGAVLVAQVPLLREPVQQLLGHADRGALPVVLALTLLNGLVEELFFRGALYDVLAGHGAVLLSTVVYTGVTALSGIPLLALAALLLGLVAALLRRLTLGVIAPVVAHLTWSVGMLLLLGPTLALLEHP